LLNVSVVRALVAARPIPERGAPISREQADDEDDRYNDEH
jgi:hypothetical protein